MVRKAGGGIVNPNPSPTAVEVRPPCTIYNSGVWSGVCVCLAGIHWRFCGIAFYEKESVWLRGAQCCPCLHSNCPDCLFQERGMCYPHWFSSPEPSLQKACAPLNSSKMAFGECGVENLQTWVGPSGG